MKIMNIVGALSVFVGSSVMTSYADEYQSKPIELLSKAQFKCGCLCSTNGLPSGPLVPTDEQLSDFEWLFDLPARPETCSSYNGIACKGIVDDGNGGQTTGYGELTSCKKIAVPGGQGNTDEIKAGFFEYEYAQ